MCSVLVAVAAIGLIISSIMSLVVKVKEIELLEDEQGRCDLAHVMAEALSLASWRRGIALTLWERCSMLVASVAVQSYLGFTGEIKVATVQATPITNMPHMMIVSLTLYDQNGQQISHEEYSLNGDRWELDGDVVKFQPWLNFFGVHWGYKISRLTSQYDDTNAHTIKPISLNGGDEDFYNSICNKTWWSTPAVMAVYGTAILEPADSVIYDVFMDQTAMLAIPEKS